MATKRYRKQADGLNDRQAQFVREYLVDLNATGAAERCGYKYPNTQGPRLLVNVRIATAIAKAREKVETKLEITAEQIWGELAKLGFANMADYMKVGPDGDPYLDFSALSRDQAAALTEVTVEDYVDGRGDDAREVKRVKFKLADKRASLMDLAKLRGFVKERHEHTGKDGGPIETAEKPWDLTKLSDDEFEHLKTMRARAAKPLTNGHDPHRNGHDPADVPTPH